MTRWPPGGISADWRRRLTDPFEMSVLTVAVMFVGAFAAVASVVWPPLGYLVAAAALPIFPRVYRNARHELSTGNVVAQAWMITGTFLTLSIPVSQLFFRNDLNALAAPHASAVYAGQGDLAQSASEPIYGHSGSFPSYGLCQSIQQLAGTTPAQSCYSTVGFLRLWQMPVALPTLLAVTLLYIGIPLAVAFFAPSRRLPRGS